MRVSSRQTTRSTRESLRLIEVGEGGSGERFPLVFVAILRRDKLIRIK